MKDLKKTFSIEVTEAIRENMPAGEDIVNYLAVLLDLKKESVKRRIKGTVPFTFQEIAQISNTLGISIDSLIDKCYSGSKISLSIESLGYEEPVECFKKTLQRCIYLLENKNRSGNSARHVASDVIPFVFCESKYSILNFVLLRWVYNFKKIHVPGKLSDFEMPQDLKKLASKLIVELKNIKNTTFIFDNGIFSNIVKDICYFVEVGLITRSDAELLRNELYDIGADMEKVAATGRFSSGRDVRMYLTNISFDTSYTYIQNERSECCMFKIYSVNSVDSHNPKVCGVQKKWIDFLKSHSTLITKSGEYERTRFFEDQREIIRKLDSLLK